MKAHLNRFYQLEEWEWEIVSRGDPLSLEWKSLLEDFRCLKACVGVPQNPKFHEEGDVWTHTQRVVKSLGELAGWEKLSLTEK
ncbi:MAG: hypothetical protein D6785_02420, partial [Planctomycetota bacterium]